MKVLFNQTINDKYNPGNTFFKGKIYDLDDNRIAELSRSIPDAVRIIDKGSVAKKPERVVENTKRKAQKTPKHITQPSDVAQNDPSTPPSTEE